MSNHDTKLEDKLFDWIKENKIVTALSLLNRYSLKYAEENNPAKKVLDTLKDLTRTERIIELYPANVNPRTATLSQTYYIVKDIHT